MISCLLSSLAKPPTNPDPQQIERIRRQLWKGVPVFKRNRHRTNVFSRTIFRDLVEAAVVLARKEGLLAA
jgi:hypothetical protein